MRLAIDAMGGDHAPAEQVAGCLQVATEAPDTQFLLVGQQEAIEAELADRALPANVSIHHTDEVVEMDDNPAAAVRRKRNSSLCVACRLVAEGEAQAVISAGNTGAAAAAATLHIGRIPGVYRPCIATVLPAVDGHVIVCDAGASVDSKPEWVVQFGVMAAIYAEEVERIAQPRVGLLSIGEEACKGNALTKAAHELFGDAGVNWVGNVDPKDTFHGFADVIACDGFDGNLLLKVAESAADMFCQLTSRAVRSTPLSRIGGLMVKPALRGMARTINYAEYGGAFLLGVKGVVVIGHGRSKSLAMANALRRAREGVERGLVTRLEQRFAANGATPVA